MVRGGFVVCCGVFWDDTNLRLMGWMVMLSACTEIGLLCPCQALYPALFRSVVRNAKSCLEFVRLVDLFGNAPAHCVHTMLPLSHQPNSSPLQA